MIGVIPHFMTTVEWDHKGLSQLIIVDTMHERKARFLEDVDAVVAILPSLNGPTVSHLYKSDWLAVESVVDSSVVRDLIPKLIKAGAEGIIEYPLNKVL